MLDLGYHIMLAGGQCHGHVFDQGVLRAERKSCKARREKFIFEYLTLTMIQFGQASMGLVIMMMMIFHLSRSSLGWGCQPTTDHQREQSTVTDPPDTISPPSLPLFIEISETNYCKIISTFPCPNFWTLNN